MEMRGKEKIMSEGFVSVFHLDFSSFCTFPLIFSRTFSPSLNHLWIERCPFLSGILFWWEKYCPPITGMDNKMVGLLPNLTVSHDSQRTFLSSPIEYNQGDWLGSSLKKNFIISVNCKWNEPRIMKAFPRNELIIWRTQSPTLSRSRSLVRKVNIFNIKYRAYDVGILVFGPVGTLGNWKRRRHTRHQGFGSGVLVVGIATNEITVFESGSAGPEARNRKLRSGSGVSGV